MAAAETHLDMKIFFHKERNRVLFVEADGVFIDVLFSFLTLPLGTIVKLIRKTQSTEPSNVGGFSNLYQSVKSLGNEYFCAEVFKEMLVQPRSSSEDRSRMLKINIDDTEAKYFLCPHKFFSIYQNTMCRYCCGPLSIVKSLGSSTCSSKVYVTVASKFIITEDLLVKPVVPGTVMALLNDLGVNDKISSIGSTEGHLDLKIFVDKVQSRVVLAEADCDFVDVLSSFLTLPLGTIVRLNGKTQSEPTAVGSLSTLYRSVKSLGNEHFCDEVFKHMLMHSNRSSEDQFRKPIVNVDDTEYKYYDCPHKYYSSECGESVSIY